MSVGKWVRAQVLCHKAATSGWEGSQMATPGRSFVSHPPRSCGLSQVSGAGQCWERWDLPWGQGCFLSPALLHQTWICPSRDSDARAIPAHPVRVDSKVPGRAFSNLVVCFSQSDQIDENLKLALQQDLTTMAPGLIIQVIRIPP